MDDLIRLLKDLRSAEERTRSCRGDTPDAAAAQREVERLRERIWSTGRAPSTDGGGSNHLRTR